MGSVKINTKQIILDRMGRREDKMKVSKKKKATHRHDMQSLADVTQNEIKEDYDRAGNNTG
jgi:Tfp pilus assembly major pilin PilA